MREDGYYWARHRKDTVPAAEVDGPWEIVQMRRGLLRKIGNTNLYNPDYFEFGIQLSPPSAS